MAQKDWLSSISAVGPSTAGVGVAAVVASAAAWLLRPPAPLANRLLAIDESKVEIDNDGIYESFDWWNVSGTVA